uniref:Uncharacterized protein n=1 Tax=Anopheles arabiensis TaxID=7173 RepID=A0A182HXF2_ANOAR
MYRKYSELYAERTPDTQNNQSVQHTETPSNNFSSSQARSPLCNKKKSASRKSPGPDGIPKEFYIRTFDIISRELTYVLNDALQGNIPSCFVDGIIVLVQKKGSTAGLSNFRPISLLNFDYKLLSRMLKIRMQGIIETWHIISPSQKCSNKPHNIFEAVLAIKEKIIDFKRKRIRGKLVSFDLTQAFDRVDRRFLWTTMASLGFNARLIELLTYIGNQSSSRLLVNGHLSPSFPIQRSVRQGDPLSMMLFVLYLHPLLTTLEGLCNNQNDLINAYADDISVISTSLNKIELVRQTIETFGYYSGAMLSMEKTTALDIGHITTNNTIETPWLRTVERLRLLGILFTNNIREAMSNNWDIVIEKFRWMVWYHRRRNLNLCQKITLLNTFILPKVWFTASAYYSGVEVDVLEFPYNNLQNCVED